MQSLTNIEMVAFVTGRYHWLVNPLIIAYWKYFNVPITFLTDREMNLPYYHKQVQCFGADCKLYKEEVGRTIKEELRKIDKPIIGMIFMDFIPQKPMDFEKLDYLSECMCRDKIARGNLWDEVEGGLVGHPLVWEIDNYDKPNIKFRIVKIPKEIGQIGCTSLMPALWSKDFLLEFIEDQWTLDAIELPGQHKFLAQDSWYSIGSVPSLFKVGHICYTADSTEARLAGIKEEDRCFIEPFVPKEFHIT